MKRKLALLLLTLGLVLVAANPSIALPAYCNCSDCYAASWDARCTLPGTNQVIICDDYEWYYCDPVW
jgi:hypothetical protein